MTIASIPDLRKLAKRTVAGSDVDSSTARQTTRSPIAEHGQIQRCDGAPMLRGVQDVDLPRP